MGTCGGKQEPKAAFVQRRFSQTEHQLKGARAQQPAAEQRPAQQPAQQQPEQPPQQQHSSPPSGPLSRSPSDRRPLPPAPTAAFVPTEVQTFEISATSPRRDVAHVPRFADGAPTVDIVFSADDDTPEPKLRAEPRQHPSGGVAPEQRAATAAAAAQLQLDERRDRDRMWMARALAAEYLPVGWASSRAGREQRQYENQQSGLGQMEHPMLEHWRHLLHEARQGVTGDERPHCLASRRTVPTAEVLGRGMGLRSFDGTPAVDSEASPDFNEDFQALWETKALQVGQIKQREEAINEVLDQFHAAAAAAASAYAERFAAGKAKEEERVGNLLISLVNGINGKRLFGSAAVAAKFASHEARGWRCVLAANQPDLHVPLHCLVVYLGLRIFVAAAAPCKAGEVALGPVNTDQPPKGRKYVQGEPATKRLTGIVASALRLREHTTAGGVQVAGAATLQIHRGSDKRMYVTRSGGLLPSIPTVQVDVYRPPLLRAFRATQGNAGFFQPKDEREAVDLVRRFLVEKYLPDYAAKFVDDPGNNSGATLTSTMHDSGIGMRELGTLHAVLSAKAAPQKKIELVAAEMIARTLKHIVREMVSINDFFRQYEANSQIIMPTVHEKFPGYRGDRLDAPGQLVARRLSEMIGAKVDVGMGKVAVIRELNDAAVHQRSKVRHRPITLAWPRAFQRIRPELLAQIDATNPRSRLNADGLTTEAALSDIAEDYKRIDALFNVKLFDPEHTRECDVAVQASHILSHPPASGAELTRGMHQNGINMRYLGAMLDFCLDWQYDGDCRPALNEDTGKPAAVELLLTEMIARSFRGYLESQLHGMTYTSATAAAKSAFQMLLSEPAFLVPRMRRAFGGPLKFDFPPAAGIVRRCCELCGAMVAMVSPETVGEVSLTPVVKRFELPESVSAGRFITEAQPTREETTAIGRVEQAILARIAAPEREDYMPSQLCDYAQLSVVYERSAVAFPGMYRKELLSVRDRMLDCVPAGSPEAGDINMMLGDYWGEQGQESDRARKHYSDAIAIYEKAGPDCVSNHVSALQALGDAMLADGEPEEAGLCFVRARGLVDPEEDPERCAELDKRAADASLAQEDKLPDVERNLDRVARMYQKAAEVGMRSEDGELAEIVGDCLSALARLQYRLAEYEQACANFRKAVEAKKHNHGALSFPVADDLFNLGQAEMFLGRLERERGDDHFAEAKLDCATATLGGALAAYEKSLSGLERTKRCQRVLKDLARCNTERGFKSAALKCELTALQYEMPDDHPKVATKLHEVAKQLAAEARKDPQIRDEAIAYYRRAYVSLAKARGDDDENTIKCRQELQQLSK
eukprot:TRINITY_DN3581_c0_g1_i2.p1 TRINITY_DN3581_c0_g1~~TRINITY_DN3581_c0_g1_i2.p1  ORF type:complete len:1354 (+),score=474.87 TRINITY_DN3581_c0_g1_i2:87-4064(+)